MTSWSIAALLLLSVSSLWIGSGLVALLLTTRRRAREHRAARATLAPAALPPVSVLKPVRGVDPGLEQNLESFFRQDHPRYQLVFGATDADEPALATVERVRARHPEVASTVVVHAGGAALNPKVDNLLGMLPRAAHDLVVISDSNIRVPPHYLSELASVRLATHAGLVSNLFAGVGENTLGAALENVQLAGFCAPGAALPTLLGSAAIIGKSAMFSRTELNELGGLEKLANVLAEDFVMGKMFQRAERRVELAPSVLESHTSNLSLRAFFDRHVRWGMIRWQLRPLAALCEPLTSPLALLPLGWVTLGWPALIWVGTLLALRDTGAWWILRGPRNLFVPLLLSPLREVLLLAAWLASAFKRHVRWRGTRLRVDAGTLLFIER